MLEDKMRMTTRKRPDEGASVCETEKDIHELYEKLFAGRPAPQIVPRVMRTYRNPFDNPYYIYR
jgi:hypothetical protein